MTRARGIAGLVAALLLAGCAGLDHTLGKVPQPEGAARTAYARVERAKVFSHPDGGAEVLGLLSRNEKIARYQSESGFAYVEAKGNLAGWVHEDELADAPPRAPKPAEAQAPAPSTVTPSEASKPAEPEQPEDSVESEEPPGGEPATPERSPSPPTWRG